MRKLRKLRKLTTLLALSLTLTLAMPNVLPFAQTMQTAEASTIKINKKQASLAVGRTIRLKISGTNKKVTWKSSKKSVATVSSTGKVTAQSGGSATITAITNNKKYTCKVKVNTSKYAKNAPFKANEVKFNDINIVAPIKWKLKMTGSGAASLNPPSMPLGSGIYLQLTKTGYAALDFNVAKSIYTNIFTEEYFKTLLGDEETDVTITRKNVSDYKTNDGTALKFEFDVTMAEKASKSVTGASISNAIKINYKICVHIIYIDNYLFMATSMDADNADMDSVAQYIIKTFTVNK